MTTTTTNDEINSMALEAGFDHYLIVRDFSKQLKRFAALVAAHEREACAKLCEDYTDNDRGAYSDDEGHGYECAAAIRARSEKC